MKVFTFFYNRFETATTSKALFENGIGHNVLIHKEQDYELFKKGNTLFGNPIVTNSQKGLAYQRNYALDMMDFGEWAVFMCDDFKKIASYPKDRILSNELTMDSSDNSMLVYPAWRNVHGVTPIVATKEGGYRNSLVFYPLKAFKNC